ncbi:MAG: PKD domain-containing protein [Halobacteriales archaeon]|nr:PKD domain-containing protein [Halobacteriales archaeon]
MSRVSLRLAALVTIALVLGSTAGLNALARPPETPEEWDEARELLGQAGEPILERVPIVDELAVDGTGATTGIPGANGSPVPTDSPLAFAVYQVPPDMGADFSGEPTISVNWNTDHAFFKTNSNLVRAEFDDSQDPAGVSWVNVGDVVASLGGNIDPRSAGDHTTGRVWIADLDGPGRVAYSDNEGTDWTNSEPAAPLPSYDHQSLAAGGFPSNIPNPGVYEHFVAYCSQSGATAGFEECVTSVDGGLTWGPQQVMDGLQCQALFGQIVIDASGTIYVPQGRCYDGPDPDCGETELEFETGVGDAVCPLASGWLQSSDGGLNWEKVVVPGSGSARTDPGLALDDGGNVYLGWSNGASRAGLDTGPEYATVRHADGSWGPVTDIGAPFGIQNGVFTQAIAGDDGRAAIAFLGTPTPGDTQQADFRGEWHMYVAFTYDTGATWTVIDATPTDPVQRGCVWLEGGSSDCRNLLDFNSIDLDSSGRVLIGYADGCTTQHCINRGGTSLESHRADGFILRQSGGPRLRAASDPAPAEGLRATARGAETSVGMPVNVDAAAVGGQVPHAYAWDFDGDGSFSDASGQSPLFPATSEGTFPIAVQVTDGAGSTATAAAAVTVLGVPGQGSSFALSRSNSFDGPDGSCDAQGWIARGGRYVETDPLAADFPAVSAGGTQFHLQTVAPASPACAWYNGDDATRMYTEHGVAELDSPTGGAGCYYWPADAQGGQFTFNLAGDAELGFDFLEVYVLPGFCSAQSYNNNTVVSGNGNQADASLSYLGPISPTYSGPIGDLSTSTYVPQTISLPTLPTGPFSLRFRFQSDILVNSTGYQLDDMQLFLNDHVPTLDAVADEQLVDTDTLSLQLVGADQDPNEGLTYAVTGLPAGASLDPATGALSWSPTHADIGAHDAVFSVTDGALTASQAATITVLNVLPVAGGSSDLTSTDRLTPVHFTDASTDADGSIASRLWDFGDGATSTATSPTHLYGALGTFSPTLTVTDDSGDTGSVALPDITVTNIAPIAAFLGPVGDADRADPAQFTDASVDPDGTIVSWLWDFGDGATSAEQSPSHQFAALGTFPVTLTVTDSDGATSTASQDVTVANLVPTAGFSVAPTVPHALLPTLFTDGSADRDGAVTAWHWTFGDGAQSSDASPAHVYLQGGLYDVRLTVTDNDGAASSLTQLVFVCGEGFDLNNVLNLTHQHIDVLACVDLTLGDLPPLPP